MKATVEVLREFCAERTSSHDDDLRSLRVEFVKRLRMRLPVHDAEDLVQEGLCRAAAHGLLEADYLRMWLWRVCWNLLMDRGRAPRYGSDPIEELAIVEVEGGFDLIDDQLLASQAQSMLGSLSAEQQAVIRSLALGNPVSQIARDNQMTVRSVEGHLRRARIKLRRALSGSN